MYCKNCGKYLEEGTRFCDRCGQSVRKNTNSEQAERHRNIEELKEERLNRKKRLAEQEAREEIRRKYKKKRRKSTGGAMAFVIAVILLAIVSITVSYHLATKDSSIKMNNDTSPAPTVKTTASSSAGNQIQQTPSSTGKAQEEKHSSLSPDGFRVFEINNVGCPYPSGFTKQAVSGSAKLSLTDTVGGATMMVSQELGIKGSPAELMKEYAGTLGVNPDYSRATKDNYSITAKKNGTVYHRKCIISGSSAIYYDFTYQSTSSSRAQYEQYIEYIDENMTAK